MQYRSLILNIYLSIDIRVFKSNGNIRATVAATWVSRCSCVASGVFQLCLPIDANAVDLRLFKEGFWHSALVLVVLESTRIDSRSNQKGQRKSEPATDSWDPPYGVDTYMTRYSVKNYRTGIKALGRGQSVRFPVFQSYIAGLEKLVDSLNQSDIISRHMTGVGLHYLLLRHASSNGLSRLSVLIRVRGHYRLTLQRCGHSILYWTSRR